MVKQEHSSIAPAAGMYAVLASIADGADNLTGYRFRTERKARDACNRLKATHRGACLAYCPTPEESARLNEEGRRVWQFGVGYWQVVRDQGQGPRRVLFVPLLAAMYSTRAKARATLRAMRASSPDAYIVRVWRDYHPDRPEDHADRAQLLAQII